MRYTYYTDNSEAFCMPVNEVMRHMLAEEKYWH